MKKYLISLGWTVFRSAGSHSCADLIAFKENKRPLWLQCKASDKPSLSKKEMKEMKNGVNRLDLNVLAVCRSSYNSKLIWYGFVGEEFGQLVKEPRWLKT
jgi:hypothetical protein